MYTIGREVHPFRGRAGTSRLGVRSVPHGGMKAPRTRRRYTRLAGFPGRGRRPRAQPSPRSGGRRCMRRVARGCAGPLVGAQPFILPSPSLGQAPAIRATAGWPGGHGPRTCPPGCGCIDRRCMHGGLQRAASGATASATSDCAQSDVLDAGCSSSPPPRPLIVRSVAKKYAILVRTFVWCFVFCRAG